MNTTLKLDIPSVDQVTAGLSPADCHPPLAEAEAAVTAASARLKEAQQEHADEQERLASMHADGAGIDAIADVLLRPQAAAMITEQCENDLGAARELVDREKANAQKAYAKEIEERVARLQDLADELSPVLRELRAGWIALERRGGYTRLLAWPTSPNERHRVPHWKTD